MSPNPRFLIAGILVGSIFCPGIAPILAQDFYNLDEYEKATGKKIQKYNEAPLLIERVAAGQLPAVEKRLPENPLVMEAWGDDGKNGGKPKDL